MSVISGKIEDMKAMSWPLAMVATSAILVIGVLAFFNRDVTAVSSAIITLLLALGIAELREIKSNTNGTNAKIMNELTESRRAQAQNFQTALANPAVTPKEAGQADPASAPVITQRIPSVPMDPPA